MRKTVPVALLLTAFLLQGCLAAAAVGVVAGTAVGVTGAVVGGAAKGVGAAGRAVIPGDSKD